jgi:hypothetical protein
LSNKKEEIENHIILAPTVRERDQLRCIHNREEQLRERLIVRSKEEQEID